MAMPYPARLPISIPTRTPEKGLDSPASHRHRRRSNRSPVLIDRRRSDARVAQLVEHMTENHGVGGSIPSPGTIAPSTGVLLLPDRSILSLYFSNLYSGRVREAPLASAKFGGISEGI